MLFKFFIRIPTKRRSEFFCWASRSKSISVKQSKTLRRTNKRGRRHLHTVEQMLQGFSETWLSLALNDCMDFCTWGAAAFVMPMAFIGFISVIVVAAAFRLIVLGVGIITGEMVHTLEVNSNGSNGKIDNNYNCKQTQRNNGRLKRAWSSEFI